ncbi:uncharacterized protein L969DRAFT_17100 [Mixia osmundae IAM 14324]|uniref:Ribosome biogenesis protein NOP53 n=1 Tax=Mixia osmundae (strain CBS 9802 / IAM 14324 / JCM 22182 / KY 12970) TaxID=764103 RepID=G7E8A0_MIXOS|nr:uncharacterized protein L969DRAFT_17100 [Mixia osmundae IAM 14324]KEI39163.1 hypothetical protein L969DRAFT_17100 [Mixia osmundae IAM 14324]GAA99060.1 hypothetical protein E5Q_05749 [Mixia osmundae IAM 14324]
MSKKPVKKAGDQDLFEVDDEGVEALRPIIERSTGELYATGDQAGEVPLSRARKGQLTRKPLRSDEILAARTKHPALFSRARPHPLQVTHAQQKMQESKIKLSASERRRMNAVIRRGTAGKEGLFKLKLDRVGDSNYVVELREAISRPIESDLWMETDQASLNKQGKRKADSDQTENVVPPDTAVEPPATAKQRTLSASSVLDRASRARLPPAVSLPHAGTSYNPDIESHQSLLSQALQDIQSEESRAAALRAVKQKIEAGRRATKSKELWEIAEELAEKEETDDQPEEISQDPPLVPKKTQRRKSAKQKLKRRANINKELAAVKRKQTTKQQRELFATLPKLSTSLNRLDAQRETDSEAKQTAAEARLTALGFSGKKTGPARVAKPKITYQLGEDIPEGLRLLHTEGNLWRDFKDSATRRGIIQTTRPPRQAKMALRSTKNVEKYSYRRDD